MKILSVILGGLTLASLGSAQQRGIINNAESPHVKLKSINIGGLLGGLALGGLKG